MSRTSKIWRPGAWVLALAVLWPQYAWAQVPVPKLLGPLNDGARVAGAQGPDIERALGQLYADTGVQFVVLTLPTLKGAPLAPFAHQVMEAWRLGAPGSDLGLLLLIVTEDRLNRLEVGYGLEGAIPDVVAKRLLADVLAPKPTAQGPGTLTGDNISATVEAIDSMVRVEAQRGTLPDKTPPRPAIEGGLGVPWWAIVLGLAVIMLAARALLSAMPRYGDRAGAGMVPQDRRAGLNPGLLQWVVRLILALLSGGGPRSGPGAGGSGYSGGGGRSGGGGASDRY